MKDCFRIVLLLRFVLTYDPDQAVGPIKFFSYVNALFINGSIPEAEA